MPSERIQRQIDRLLDEAEEAASELNWAVVRDEPRRYWRTSEKILMRSPT